MYLPTFYKLFNERVLFNMKRYSGYAIPLTLWGIKIYIIKLKGLWSFYPSLYNMIYTDFIPPAKGINYLVYFKGV